MKNPSLIKIFSIYILLFFLFYFEPIQIAGIKFSVLWKLPLVALLAIYFMLIVSKKWTMPIFAFVGLLLSFKYFVSLSSFQYMSTTISEFIKFAIFFFFFFFINERYNKEILIKMGHHLSIFIVISFIPFILGLLESLGRSIDISKYGDITGTSLTGIFQNPHAAGIVLAFSLLIVLYNFLNEVNRKMKIFLLFLLFLGFIELSLIMVRTALLMFIIGALYISFMYFKLKHYIFFTLIVFVTFGYLASSYKQSIFLQSMVVRLQGDTKYHEQKTVGSGRILFSKIAIESWQSEGFTGVFFGLGMELGKDKMEEAIGSRLFAHNGFTQMLQSEGLIGILLFLLFLYFLLKYILMYRENEYYRLLIGLYIAYIIAIFFQGGNYFLLYVLFSIYLALINKSAVNKETISNMQVNEYENKNLKNENIY